MNTSKAIKALEKGEKIRRNVWKSGDYITLNNVGVIVDKNNHLCPIQFSKLYEDWDIIN